MDIQEVLQWTDEQVFLKTKQHLDSLQRAVLEGTLEGLKYPEIAENTKRSHDHIKQVARHLWKLLSDTLEEDIKQSNVRSILEKTATSNIWNYGNCSPVVSINSHINICGNRRQDEEDYQIRSPSNFNSAETKNNSPIIDLTDAPEITEFCDRTPELDTLQQWILEENTRLITIYGLRGIGKSSLVLKLVETINDKFDYIIWRSLVNAPQFAILNTQLRKRFNPFSNTPQPTTMDDFRNGRCLLILDDLQNLFAGNQLSGEYLTDYQDYGAFFQQIARNNHRSCVILLSWEKPREIVTLEAENRPVRTLHLQGLGETATEILRHRGLTNEDKWHELITSYQGHPVWLNIIASTILELFDGRVSMFLGDELFIGDLSPLLISQLDRLSDLEKQAIDWIASERQPVDISQNPADGVLSKLELWQAIQSLVRRGLVEKISAGERSHFQLNPVFQQYLQLQ
ncbi:ATP-binding protein [Lyngbya sp. CCY1209]|uniref:ATP-binding protein n=1 Tax=Lyngbya sp. CCY1209 TaxID=2886103 RepID=UPI002D208D01|nr:ATP-binding protein [Lyngbya sp. CCY1209]MEB3883371.1 ATP-binding protein [Lyngbya sp. CCY1209]